MPDQFSSQTNDPRPIASVTTEAMAAIDGAVAAPVPGARPIRPEHPARDPVAVELGRRGGLKGGKARAAQLSPEQRKAIATKAAQARWGIKVPVAQDAFAAVVASPTVSVASADTPPDDLALLMATPADVTLDPPVPAATTLLERPVPAATTVLDWTVMAADAALPEDPEAALATPPVPQLAVLPLTVRGASAAADWQAVDLQSARATESLAWRLAPSPEDTGQATPVLPNSTAAAAVQPAVPGTPDPLADPPARETSMGPQAFQSPQASSGAASAPVAAGTQASPMRDPQASGAPQASAEAPRPGAATPAGYERLDGLPGVDGPTQLRLTDWRRRVADLYSDVRRLALTDAEASWALWCSAREGLYRRHPLSPVPADRRAAFDARHFPYNSELRFELPVRPDSQGRAQAVGAATNAIALPNSGPEPMTFERVGRVDVPIGGSTYKLSLFWIPGYAGGLFLPFRDGTNGSETYGAGRYLLDTAKGADLGPGLSTPGTIVVDFNFAFQPSCAFDPRWACPLAPPENRLDVPIRAGERMS